METKSPAVSLPSVDPAKPPSKAHVVGWPPVRSFRKNIAVHKKGNVDGHGDGEKNACDTASLVKVSVNGAPYLRKVDLEAYKSYKELSIALSNMFSSFTSGKRGSEGTKDFMNERNSVDLLHNSDYIPSYKDKDGDWMLVGDVPWEMFVDSCKRLRISKGSEAL